MYSCVLYKIQRLDLTVLQLQANQISFNAYNIYHNGQVTATNGQVSNNGNDIVIYLFIFIAADYALVIKTNIYKKTTTSVL